MGYPVIWRIEDIYYPVIAAVGIPVNLVAIVILSRGKCGLSKCITRYLQGMAAADLLVVISDPLLRCIVCIYFSTSFLNRTPVCRVARCLLIASTGVSVWLTVAFTCDRFVAICSEKLKTKYCTERTATVVIGTVSVLGPLESIPFYFTIEPSMLINGVFYGCVSKDSFYTSPSWAALEMIHRIFMPGLPFVLTLLLNALTVSRILSANKIRLGFRGRSNGKKDKDQEMENRRKSVVLLFSITGSFIFLWLTWLVFDIYRRAANTPFYSAADPIYIADGTATMLQILSSCTNTCIYAVTQSKFREELKNAVKYPLKLLTKFSKS